MACLHSHRIPTIGTVTRTSVSGPFVYRCLLLVTSANLLSISVLSVPISVPVRLIPTNLSNVLGSQEEFVRQGGKVLTHRGANYPTVKKDMSALLFPTNEEEHYGRDHGEELSIFFPEQDTAPAAAIKTSSSNNDQEQDGRSVVDVSSLSLVRSAPLRCPSGYSLGSDSVCREVVGI